MPRKIVLHFEARLEFEEAIDWYEQKEPGLGFKFEDEVHAAFQKILKDPERFRLVGPTTRKARVEVFDKYSIYFHVEPSFIGVVSIFHGSRDPAELRPRLR